MSLWAVLLTGVFAGGASCAAVQGGLLAGTLARRPAERTHENAAIPVGAFLAGKLAAHTVLGAALGLLGSAVQISTPARALIQIAAGLAMILLALNLFGVKAMRGLVPQAPPAWSRAVRRSGRRAGSFAPALLGIATVLIPCGVTLSMMILAAASGSALAGAAIMATFVIGTMPLFAALGYAARKSASALRGRLGLLTGAAVLVAGLVSINAGLVLNGSSFTLSGAFGNVAGSEPPRAVAAAPVAADGVQRIVIEAHNSGYSPSLLKVRANVPTQLTIRTSNTVGCTQYIIMSEFGVEKSLPRSGNTRIDLGELEPGTYRYTCGMGMYRGAIEAIA